MDYIDIKTSISSQIEELNKRKILFIIKSNRIENCNNLNQIDDKIIVSKRGYYIYTIFSLICGGFLYVAGFAQIFQHNFIDWTKSGLLIVLTIGNIGQAWNTKIDLERLKMMKYLFGLRNKLEK